MNTMQASKADGTRPIDRWFAHYSDDHRNAANQRIHVFAVPMILWSVIALLWCIPTPGTLFRDGVWAGLAMAAAGAFYVRASRPLGAGMVFVFVLMGLLTHAIAIALGLRVLLMAAIVVFVIAWIAQFVGHKLEGRKPSFLTDLTYLLIGPAWVLAKLYRRLGLRY